MLIFSFSKYHENSLQEIQKKHLKTIIRFEQIYSDFNL